MLCLRLIKARACLLESEMFYARRYHELLQW